jgi:TonB family protein
MVTVAIVASVMIHGGILSACFYLSRDSFRMIHVRHGAAASENQIILLSSTDAPSPQIEFMTQSMRLGTSDFDRVAEELARHRDIERAKRIDETISVVLSDPFRDASVTSTVQTVRRRNPMEPFDEIKPSSIQPRIRPRLRIRQPFVSGTPPKVPQAGAESWVPEPLAEKEPPDYPIDAEKMRAEGTTYLRVTVSNEGAVVRIEIKQSSGWPALDQAAAGAVSNWRFHPQSSVFASKSQSVVIPIEFVLNR